jgi:hypothetical protein
MIDNATFEEKALIELAYQYRAQFYKCGVEEFYEILGRGRVVTRLFCQIYLVLLKYNAMVEIETLTEADKRKLTDEALRVSYPVRDRKHIIDVAKALHTLSVITELD